MANRKWQMANGYLRHLFDMFGQLWRTQPIANVEGDLIIVLKQIFSIVKARRPDGEVLVKSFWFFTYYQ